MFANLPRASRSPEHRGKIGSEPVAGRRIKDAKPV
jgi:hypothetical protein